MNLIKFLISYCKESAECALKQAVRIGLQEVVNELTNSTMSAGLKDLCTFSGTQTTVQ